MLIANVCVNVTTNAINKNFTYRVPERLNVTNRKLRGLKVSARRNDEVLPC